MYKTTFLKGGFTASVVGLLAIIVLVKFGIGIAVQNAPWLIWSALGVVSLILGRITKRAFLTGAGVFALIGELLQFVDIVAYLQGAGWPDWFIYGPWIILVIAAGAPLLWRWLESIPTDM